MTTMEWQFATQTHCGNRRKVNEDSLILEKAYPLCAVADGMGGHEAGDFASKMLTDDLAMLNINGKNIELVRQEIARSIEASNSRLIAYAKSNFPGKTMGSTIVAMLMNGMQGYCLWAGDSRLYRLRAGQLDQLTEDHSYVADLVRAGEITAEEAKDHPSSNIITRAIGVDPEVKLDHRSFDIYPHDTYLLCSDGLYNEASVNELAQAMQHPDIYRSSVQLLNTCLEREARDNISFILARLVESDDADEDLGETLYP